jgi:hypothetical protein
VTSEPDSISNGNSIETQADNSTSSADRWEADMARREAEQKKKSLALLADLSEPFPPEVERELKKGGTYLTYIPVSEVITRLNRVFGVMGWSSHIIKCERDSLDPDFIVAHVRLEVDSGGCDAYGAGVITKDGFGGQKIKRTKQGEIVDLGDEFKGAVSDALKKAAQQFGVALYLSRSDEALSIEVEQDLALQRENIDPKIVALWGQFREISGSLDAEQKAGLGKFWNEYSNGAPKPTIETATPQMLMALIEECTRLCFPGSNLITQETADE